MKFNFYVLTAVIIAVTAVGFGQSKPKTLAPDAVVRDLYAAHKAHRSPFFQNKNRKLVDKYFTGALADAIWKEAVDSKPGEVGNLDFDPLYYAQDVHIKNFVVAKADANNVVKVTFLNMGHPEEINFFLTTANTSSKVYKIDSIMYSDAEDLESILSYEIPPDGTPEKTIPMDGNYMIGRVKCSVETAKNGYWARVICDDQPKDSFQVIDTETLTFGTFNKKEKGRRGKFMLAADGSINKYIDGSGKEIKVSRTN
ncbi:hypothetical protein BH10ACI3_BH10ACI3_02970 [soil metagenome]